MAPQNRDIKCIRYLVYCLTICNCTISTLVILHECLFLSKEYHAFYRYKCHRAHIDFKNLRDLSWLSITDRVRFFRMTHIFRIRHKLAPSYLLPNFRSVSEAHTHNTRGSGFNFVLSRELSLSPTSFAFLAIKQWNELPSSLKSIAEYRVFKRKLKEFFISQYD